MRQADGATPKRTIAHVVLDRIGGQTALPKRCSVLDRTRCGPRAGGELESGVALEVYRCDFCSYWHLTSAVGRER